MPEPTNKSVANTSVNAGINKSVANAYVNAGTNESINARTNESVTNASAVTVLWSLEEIQVLKGLMAKQSFSEADAAHILVNKTRRQICSKDQGLKLADAD
jgi:hypothetical protein